VFESSIEIFGGNFSFSREGSGMFSFPGEDGVRSGTTGLCT
jgi:hypothetical protein